MRIQDSTIRAKEKIAGMVELLRQRQVKEQQAAERWQAAVSTCLAIAEEVLKGTTATAQLDEHKLVLQSKHGCRAEFAFDPASVSMIGKKFFPNQSSGETFFSWRIAPPPRPQGQSPHQWGPSRPEGVPAPPPPDPQEAFEKAIADWFEWAHIGAGAPPAAL